MLTCWNIFYFPEICVYKYQVVPLGLRLVPHLKNCYVSRTSSIKAIKSYIKIAIRLGHMNRWIFSPLLSRCSCGREVTFPFMRWESMAIRVYDIVAHSYGLWCTRPVFPKYEKKKRREPKDISFLDIPRLKTTFPLTSVHTSIQLLSSQLSSFLK